MFAENKPIKKHNETHLENLDSQLVCIDAADEFSRNITVSESQIDAIKQRNMDIGDRLMNCLVGRVTEFNS